LRQRKSGQIYRYDRAAQAIKHMPTGSQQEIDAPVINPDLPGGNRPSILSAANMAGRHSMVAGAFRETHSNPVVPKGA
jgi:hypothetical protein